MKLTDNYHTPLIQCLDRWSERVDSASDLEIAGDMLATCTVASCFPCDAAEFPYTTIMPCCCANGPEATLKGSPLMHHISSRTTPARVVDSTVAHALEVATGNDLIRVFTRRLRIPGVIQSQAAEGLKTISSEEGKGFFYQIGLHHPHFRCMGETSAHGFAWQLQPQKEMGDLLQPRHKNSTKSSNSMDLDVFSNEGKQAVVEYDTETFLPLVPPPKAPILENIVQRVKSPICVSHQGICSSIVERELPKAVMLRRHAVLVIMVNILRSAQQKDISNNVVAPTV